MTVIPPTLMPTDMGKVKPCAVLADALPHGVEEILTSVNAGFLVGRDVSRIERAERQRESEAASKSLTARHRVTDHAVGGRCEVFAAPHGAGFGEIGRNAGRTSFAIVSERHRRTAGKRERPGAEDTPGERTDGDDDDSGNNNNGDAAHGGYAFFIAMAARSIGSRRRGTPVAA